MFLTVFLDPWLKPQFSHFFMNRNVPFPSIIITIYITHNQKVTKRKNQLLPLDCYLISIMGIALSFLFFLGSTGFSLWSYKNLNNLHEDFVLFLFLCVCLVNLSYIYFSKRNKCYMSIWLSNITSFVTCQIRCAKIEGKKKKKKI